MADKIEVLYGYLYTDEGDELSAAGPKKYVVTFGAQVPDNQLDDIVDVLGTGRKNAKLIGQDKKIHAKKIKEAKLKEKVK
jgi:hypothetical protein